VALRTTVVGSWWKLDEHGIETPKKIRDRAADWARVVGEERLWISPSCGFGRHPARSRAVLRAKMENMMDAAASF
jgi:methionine synthase II (cobalamin-independent)